MKTSKLGRKWLLSSIAGSMFAFGMASQAIAAPTFTIDPNAIPGVATTQFDATFISGFSSELLTLNGNDASGSGWIQFQSFSNGALAVLPGISRLGVDYQLYATFSLTDHLNSGTAGAAGSTYQLDTLDFQVFADPGLNTAFTAASSAGTGTNATVGGITNDDIVLAFGDLITGTAGFNALGGAFLNSIETFAVCTGNGTATLGGIPVPSANCTSGVGNSYFKAPHPFFNVAFDEFNKSDRSHVVL